MLRNYPRLPYFDHKMIAIYLSQTCAVVRGKFRSFIQQYTGLDTLSNVLLLIGYACAHNPHAACMFVMYRVIQKTQWPMTTCSDKQYCYFIRHNIKW